MKEKWESLCELDSERKYRLDILDFFRASKICVFCDGSPAESEPKKLLLKKLEKTVFVIQISFVEPCWKRLCRFPVKKTFIVAIFVQILLHLSDCISVFLKPDIPAH